MNLTRGTLCELLPCFRWCHMLGIVVQPTGIRIAWENQDTPVVGPIGCPVIPHNNPGFHFSQDFDFAGVM